jgi:hypothetical protein
MQSDLFLSNLPGASFRAELNQVIEALATNNGGTIDPVPAFPSMWFADWTANMLRRRRKDRKMCRQTPASIRCEIRACCASAASVSAADDVILNDGSPSSTERAMQRYGSNSEKKRRGTPERQG